MRTQTAYAALLLVGALGCNEFDPSVTACEAGDKLAHEDKFDIAVKALSTCLALPILSDSTRANALQVRAWSYSNLGQAAAAVVDQEAAFKLVQPTKYHEFINYASYLRKVGRVQDSLDAVLAAERIEGEKLSMMTQYNKGWSLLELGRHKEAVEAFTKGLPIQPDYAFVYWRRGLAYEGLGSRDLAKRDFERCAELLISKNNVAAAGDLLPTMRQKLRQYGLDDRYAL